MYVYLVVYWKGKEGVCAALVSVLLHAFFRLPTHAPTLCCLLHAFFHPPTHLLHLPRPA